ncbi:MAG TPA: RsmB/NOP family class I SAM-dependent RNA methyltransferase [Candidatus Nanoarchaeia archaeon]|nr:RsmB/NOP family class I SAM-dependent RNA methyltransferase [Candidatus Nanoarchaeia archaeon]
MEFKERFIEAYKDITDIDKFLEYSVKPLRKSIRVNTLKISVKELKSRLEGQNFSLDKIPWLKEGFWIKGERTDLGNLEEHSLGYFYVQEAASMIPPLALQPKQSDIILDMAAAPGSKTTQLASMMNNQGIIVANDITHTRLKSLTINLQRCGVRNTIITLMKGHKFSLEANKILLDAPCSGTGAIRKSLKTITIWNQDVIKRLAGAQRQLLQTGFNCLEQGGEIVYSTCSIAPEENESVVNSLLEKHDNAKLEPIHLEGLKTSPVVLEYGKEKYSEELKKCIRIWPQDNDTEGFFIARIKKE